MLLETLPQLGSAHRSVERRRELLPHFRGNARRRDQTVPRLERKRGNALLGCCPQIRRQRRPLDAGRGNEPQRTQLGVLREQREVHAHDVDLSGNERRHRRRGTLVGNV